MSQVKFLKPAYMAYRIVCVVALGKEARAQIVDGAGGYRAAFSGLARK